MDFNPTIVNLIEELDKSLKSFPPGIRYTYARLFDGTEIQKLIFSTHDFEEEACEYCRSVGWKEPK